MDSAFVVQICNADDLQPGDFFLSPWFNLRNKVLTFVSCEGVRFKYRLTESGSHEYCAFVPADFKVWRILK